MADSATTVATDDRIDGSDLLSDTEFLIARARALGNLRTNEALKPFHLRVRSYAVLSLACGSVSPTQRAIADFLSLDPSQVVAAVDSLESLGLVTRAQDPRDRRVNIVEVTPLGRATYQKAKQAVEEARDVGLAMLSPGERESLTEMLLRMAF